jgi:hypothetical protein
MRAPRPVPAHISHRLRPCGLGHVTCRSDDERHAMSLHAHSPLGERAAKLISRLAEPLPNVRAICCVTASPLSSTLRVLVIVLSIAAMTTTEVRAQGAPPDGPDGGQSIPSGSGRYIAFTSAATNLVPGDTNGSWDVFVSDRQTGALVRAASRATAPIVSATAAAPNSPRTTSTSATTGESSCSHHTRRWSRTTRTNVRERFRAATARISTTGAVR